MASLLVAALLGTACALPTAFLSVHEYPFQGQNSFPGQGQQGPQGQGRGWTNKDADDPRRQKPPVSLKEIRNMAGQMNKGLGANRGGPQDPMGNMATKPTDEKRTGQMKNVKNEMRDMFKQSAYARKVTDFEDALINMELQPVDGNPEGELDDMNGQQQNNPDADFGIPPMPAQMAQSPAFQPSSQLAQAAQYASTQPQVAQVEAQYPPMQPFPQAQQPQMPQMPVQQQIMPMQQMMPMQQQQPQQQQRVAPAQMPMQMPMQQQMAMQQPMPAQQQMPVQPRQVPMTPQMAAQQPVQVQQPAQQPAPARQPTQAQAAAH